MRAKRSKQYRKLMRQYARLGFRSPYQILLDAQIIKDSAKSKLHLGHLLSSALGGAEIKPMITQCCIRHLYNVTPSSPAEEVEKQNWIEVAKAAERRRCGHHELETPLSTLECLESVVDPKGSGTNKHRYVVASQDGEVRRRMREVVGVPLVYLKRSVMILEPMAEVTEREREREERGKVRAGLKGRVSAVTMGGVTGEKRKREDGKGEAEVPKQKKIKGVKGPNPLSVKKPKKGSEKKSAARVVEDERMVLRKAQKTDPQANVKAVDAEIAAEAAVEGNNTGDGPRKRKRKRKHTDAGDGTAAAPAAIEA